MRPARVLQQIFVGFWILYTITGDLISQDPPKTIIANKGENVRFTCRLSIPDHLMQEELHIKWKHSAHYIHPHNKSDKYLREDSGQTLLIKNVDSRDAGTYTCIVKVGDVQDIGHGALLVREPPKPPKDVSIISCSGNTVELIWTPGEDGGSEITHYQVQFNTSESPDVWHHYYDYILGEEKLTFLNLSPWGTYSFRMLARNIVGYSLPSAPTKTQCTTPPERPAGNPKDVRTLTHKQGKLIINWTPMKRLLHNGPGFKYTISWRRKGSTYWHKNVVDDPDADSWEVSVNDTYAHYEIKVKSQNQLGESRQPAFVFLGYSGEGVPQVIPKDFRLDPLKPVEAHIAHFIWEAVDTSEEKIQGDFKGYKLRYWKSSEGRHKWNEVDILISATDKDRPDVRAAINSLPAYTALRAQVSVMNQHYTGDPSQIIDFFTPEGVPDPVRDLHVQAHGTNYALLKWLPPEEPNGKLLGYDIGYQQMLGSEKKAIKALRPQIDHPETLGARITGLSANVKYRFYVWARTGTGRGEPVYLDVITKDGEPPDTPQPKFTTLDQTSVNITWAPYRLIDVTYVLEYRFAGHASWSEAISEWGRSWIVINDLMPNSEYEVRLIAKNKYGDTASSTLYRVKTQPRQGQDSHLFYQNDQMATSHDGSHSGASLPHLSLVSTWCRTLLVQTVVTLFTVYAIVC